MAIDQFRMLLLQRQLSIELRAWYGLDSVDCGDGVGDVHGAVVHGDLDGESVEKPNNCASLFRFFCRYANCGRAVCSVRQHT
jgi:hypothetical protein